MSPIEVAAVLLSQPFPLFLAIMVTAAVIIAIRFDI